MTSSNKLLRELLFRICKRNNSSLIGQCAGHVTRFLKSFAFTLNDFRCITLSFVISFLKGICFISFIFFFVNWLRFDYLNLISKGLYRFWSSRFRSSDFFEGWFNLERYILFLKRTCQITIPQIFYLPRSSIVLLRFLCLFTYNLQSKA